MKDIYQQMTDLILGQVDEAGAWKPCWSGMTSGLPRNAISKKKYRGVNILSCWVGEMLHGFTDSQWATFKQWQAIGASVRKGAKGTPIMFYKDIPGETADKDRFVARTSWVFNIAQVDGAPVAEQAAPVIELTEDARIARCEDWLATRRHAFTLTHGEGRAYWNSATDQVNMPEFAQFHTPEHYYSTLFHELTHWTGGKQRLEREMKYATTEGRAKEELVAELGAAFLAAELGIEATTREDHLSYIASWLQALKNDKRFIISAASQASAAADYLTSITQQEALAA